jgi:protein-S-isoprenylcysteine O-methyltransferase Ste14
MPWHSRIAAAMCLLPARLANGRRRDDVGYILECTMPLSAYVQSAIFLILAAVALFAAAGTVAIAGFWVYLAILAAIFAASFFLVDPDLARERMRPGGKKPPAALWLFSGILFLHWIIAGLDRGRFHWSDTVPPWLEVLGLVAVAASYALALWAMVVNRFFSSVIRIQSDRGQYVVTTGPYAVIRHPGYTAGIVIMLASGVALGSWLAAAFLAVTTLPFLLHRAIAEDRILHAELPGYRDYAGRVRWRLVPGIW